MCTLSWIKDEAGYALWFNRDELNSRAFEVPPTVRETVQGVAWLAPEDPDSGGTWLMVNAHGLTTALLNRYGSDLAAPPTMSRATRGRLVPLTAPCRTADEAIESVRRERLENTLPFHLVAIDAHGGVAELRWDGFARHLARGMDVRPPITSSSVRTAEVLRQRKSLFPAQPTSQSLRAFHHEHDPAEGAISVNMCRPDACTRSICHVRVDSAWVSLDYEPQGWLVAPMGSRSLQRLTRLQSASVAD
ncbi:MAG: hypothetical protein SynsKO_10300 [Synoicihabitans sp.]